MKARATILFLARLVVSGAEAATYPHWKTVAEIHGRGMRWVTARVQRRGSLWPTLSATLKAFRLAVRWLVDKHCVHRGGV